MNTIENYSKDEKMTVLGAILIYNAVLKDIQKRQLKSSKSTSKLLFNRSDVEKWLED